MAWTPEQRAFVLDYARRMTERSARADAVGVEFKNPHRSMQSEDLTAPRTTEITQREEETRPWPETESGLRPITDDTLIATGSGTNVCAPHARGVPGSVSTTRKGPRADHRPRATHS